MSFVDGDVVITLCIECVAVAEAHGVMRGAADANPRHVPRAVLDNEM